MSDTPPSEAQETDAPPAPVPPTPAPSPETSEELPGMDDGYTGFRPPQPDHEENSLESGPDAPPLHTDDRTRTAQPGAPSPDDDD